MDTAGRIEKFQKKFAATGYASLGRGKKPAAQPEAAEPRQGRELGVRPCLALAGRGS